MTSSRTTAQLTKLAHKVLALERYPRLQVRVVFVGPQKIRELNKRYRGKDKVTDVLSFRELDDDAAPSEKNYLGEIIICRSRIRVQAREYGVPHEEELARMTIHGALHLLGYDHIKPRDAKKMLPLQERYLEKLRRMV